MRSNGLASLLCSHQITTSHNSIRTVGNFVKWVIVSILGLALGTVMFGESVAKILAASKVSDHNHKQPP